MAIIRDYSNAFEVIDYTEELNIIPNQWGLFQSLGIFGSEGVTQNTIAIEEIDKSFGLVKDKIRGERNNVNKDYTRKIHTFPVPHFPLDDYISPKDIQGRRAYGSEAVDNLAAVRTRKMERIRWSHAATLERARAQLINSGTVYAPNGTVVVDAYTSFGITREDVNFALGVGTTDLIAKCEAVISHIQDNMLSGETMDRIVGICSPSFFSALIGHATVKEAYKYYQSQQEPLRTRLNAPGLDARYRSFDFGGILFIEYRGDLGDGALITDTEARFLPLGSMDTFYTYFAPAEKFDLVNTIGQEAYMFEYRSPKGDKIEIESESNFINLMRRPAVVVRGTSS